MAGFFKNILGGSKSASPPPSGDDSDFADFAGAPDPSPASHAAPSLADSAPSSQQTLSGAGAGAAVPYTKWYRVWERTSASDFYQEAALIPILLVMVLLNLWGKRTNRRRARAWMAAHQAPLEAEFATVGFEGPRGPGLTDVEGEGLARAMASEKKQGATVPEDALRERSANEFITYATGRQNVAFADVKITLLKRQNPFARFGEAALSFFLESVPTPVERIEMTAYAFDGKETQLVKGASGAGNSTYDGFVWAVVHKDLMKQLRNDRYDLSLTSTKDHAKLPAWATIMSENAEITEALLTPELVKAVEQAGEDLDALVVSDQPMEQPTKLDETVPKKRVSLSLRYPTGPNGFDDALPLFREFLRLPDRLVQVAHFRPEAMKRVRATRDEETRKIRRVDDEEKAEERKLQADKDKKERRDQLLKGMKAEDQRKFLEKEREKDMRKSQKRKTMKA